MDYNSKYKSSEIEGALDKVANLAKVATSGDYEDLSNKPNLGDFATKIELSTKQDTISDLADIRVNARLATTALQSHQTIYPLTINNSSGTAIVTYTPNSEASNLTLTKSMVGLGSVTNGTYAGGTKVTLNGSSKANATASFYAPTSPGTSGYWLKSNGSGAPTWASIDTLKTSLGISADASYSTLTLTSTSATAHLSFSRENAGNFITAPSGGYFSFVTNGRSVSAANASLVISADNIIYCGTNNMAQLGYASKRWSAVYATDGDFSGALTAGTFNTSSVVACGGRLRISASNGANSFGFLKAKAYTSALNIGVMDIGTNYGGTDNITNEAVDVVAMSIYRGVIGVGQQYAYETLHANQKNSIALHVTGNIVTTGTLSQGSDIRFKSVIEDKILDIRDIAEAPLFTFKWNNRADEKVYLGSSAQYWEGVAPWLVSGEDFKTLDYATLGVAGIKSIAMKMLEMKTEINELKETVKNLTM